VIFALGGITGVMVSSMPFDWQATDSYFIEAHFHYVLNGAVVFPIFAAIYYWLPKMTGYKLNRRLGVWSFWIMLISFNVSFFPMHVLGLRGMPRRVYTYGDYVGWSWLNLVASVGAGVFGLGTGITLINVAWSRWRRIPAGDDPWEADTLEWATTSPPPDYNFAAIPIVASRHPLWDQRPLPTGLSNLPETKSIGVEGALRRESAISGGLDALSEATLTVPEPSAWPCALAFAISIFLVGLLITAQLVMGIGIVAGLVALCRWTWRTEVDRP
jgi:heme/copper-type cytochrome/quinol oxidase subunit 1